jgi:glycosyltransferase involved in cell wall biosynthesis
MNILLVSSKFLPEYTGASYRIHNMYKRLRAGGADLTVSVVTSGIEQGGFARYELDGMQVHRLAPLSGLATSATGIVARGLNAMRVWTEAAIGMVALALKRPRPDLVHVFGTSGLCVAAIRWASRRRIPLVIELVTAEASPHQSLPGWRSAPVLGNSTLVICISTALAERCRALGLDASTWLRPNPVDTDRFLPALEARHDRRLRLLPFRPEARVIGMIAKFMPQKNQIFLLEALSRLSTDWHLVLAGPLVESGPNAARDQAYLAQIRRRCVELGLQERVLLVTQMVDAADYMPCFDVYALPNTNEGLATPMLEALAAGIPVVANANEPPFRQWLSSVSTGYLVPLDRDRWADAIQTAAAADPTASTANAAAIAAQCSHVRIDADFLTLIRALSVPDRQHPFDVAAVLAGKETRI